MKWIKNKIVIVGAGMVGAATLSSLLNMGMSAEIVLIDVDKKRARGEALDVSHTTSLSYSPNVHVREGEYEDCADAQIIIVTAGASAKPGEKLDRILLADKNIGVVKTIMNAIMKYTTDAILIMVTNPVDIITYLAQNHFDYPRNQIIGTGTLLDTARLRRIIAKTYLVDTKNVHGYVLGEHGETAFATWSSVNIAGIPLSDFNKTLGMDVAFDCDEVLHTVKTVGQEIIMSKGFTNYGIAGSISRLVKAILLNELSVLPVSTTLDGQYGIKDIALSLPCVVTCEGVSRKLEIPLSEDELNKLRASAEYLDGVLKQVGLKS